ncbi:HAMP domain-containing histidine kinase [Pelagibacteraceae bacterium]|jgi:two-component system, OmpR family, sensor histidine kinase ChvG|nr:HAMP domain-containing histidine kinase [Pelagibacteraceae bacterium]MDC0339921.1 HAMP domain-containing histidine kinase [Pelagibacteraceae bacterium]MDC0366432.1 HAMP domain-containing histidine kinase [Pelagibacteraceae bacterium]
MRQKKSPSILRKFLLFNLVVFSILGLFTIVYLKAIQPSLIKERTKDHYTIINNTVDHLQRLNINFNAKDIKTFLLSTRFLFQSLDRVQFYTLDGDLIGDTNILDLDQNVFSRADIIVEESIDGKIKEKDKVKKITKEQNKNLIKETILDKYQNEPIIISENIQNNFFVSTLSKIKLNKKDTGYIVVSEEANDILNAVKERKAFIIRTVLAVALVILIFSLFLNKYILKPIGLLVKFSEAIKKKSNKNIDIKNFFVREDEIGKLTRSIDEMTKELQKRTTRAESFSNDLAHEIRNPLASLKSASELLDKTTAKMESEKLLKIINHDAERIERLITDYSQMLKDEASWSREQMSKINLIEIISNVADDFRQDLKNQNKQIQIKIKNKIVSKNGYFILGIESRLEQVIANLLDNSISFSDEDNKIEIKIEETSSNLVILIKDEGPGFSETSPQKIFKRFYSNRPKSFGKHSGLGLNIVKNIVELHEGTISASNRVNKRGAQVEVLLPKFS